MRPVVLGWNVNIDIGQLLKQYNEANGLGSIEIYRKTNEVRASDEHNPLTTSPGAGWGVRFADVLEPCSPLAARRKTTTMCRGWCSRGALCSSSGASLCPFLGTVVRWWSS